MQRTATSALIALVLAVGILFLSSGSLRSEQAVNRIVATVNGRVITSNEINFRLAPLAAQLRAQYPRGGSEFQKEFLKAREEIITELIDRELVLHSFKELGGRIPPGAVDKDINEQVKRLYDGDRDRFISELRKNNLSLRSFKEMTSRKLIVQSMRASKFDRGVAVTPSEARAEYQKALHDIRDISGDRVTYRKIELPEQPDNPSLTRDDQLNLADDIIEKIQNGADFSALAKQFSTGVNADKGGLWEELQRSDLAPGFASIVFDAPIGKLIGPLQGPGKFVLIRVESRKDGPAPPFSEVREQMEARVKARKSADPYRRWIEQLRKRAIIRRKDK